MPTEPTESVGGGAHGGSTGGGSKGEEEALPHPPTDLFSRRLAVVERSGPWIRMHSHLRDPVHFGNTGEGRFDDPLMEYGILYAAEDAFGAFVESFGRKPGHNAVSWEGLRIRPLAALESERPLRLADLTGAGLARIGATGAISTGAYENAQTWARALYDHPAALDGLRYRLKHDPSRIGVALFDRVGEGAIQAHPIGTLLDYERQKLLAAIRKEYGFQLVGWPAP